jgi:hypothetical protein
MAGRNFNRIAPGHIDFQLKGIRVFINEHYLLEASTLNLSSPGKIVSISPACRGKYHRGVPVDNEPPPILHAHRAGQYRIARDFSVFDASRRRIFCVRAGHPPEISDDVPDQSGQWKKNNAEIQPRASKPESRRAMETVIVHPGEISLEIRFPLSGCREIFCRFIPPEDWRQFEVKIIPSV